MFKSPVLRTVGLVWKPIKDSRTTKRNDRAASSRVAKVEEFLRPYSLNKWRKTIYDYSHTKQPDVVTQENYKVEKQKQLNIVAKRTAAREKRINAKAMLAKAAKDAQAVRDRSALELFNKLRQEGKTLAHPSF